MEIKAEDLFNGVCRVCKKPSFVLPLSSYNQTLMCAVCSLLAPSPFMEAIKKFEKQRKTVKKFGFKEYKKCKPKP